MMQKKTTIAIADDHKLFVEGIKMVLSETNWLEWAGEAYTASAAVKLYQDKKPSILLLDYYLPDGNGLSVSTEILAKDPNAIIIILSMENDTDLVYQCKQIGVKGYLVKNLSSDELLFTIQEILKGNTVFMWETYPIIQKSEQENLLSKREMEIVGLISRGLTSNEIAESLHLSAFTVNTHRRNILRKLGLKNTAMMVQYAKERNW